MTLRIAAIIAAVILACSSLASAQSEQPILYLIVDSSGSMAAPLGDETRLTAAQAFAREEAAIASQAGRAVMLQIVGGVAPGRCEVRSATQDLAGLEDLVARGSTPLTAALERAGQDLGSRPAEIVLITDGNDTCGRNVCDAAAALRAERRRFDIRVHDLGVDPQLSDDMGCLALDEGAPHSDGDLLLPASARPSPAHGPWRDWSWIGSAFVAVCLLTLLIALVVRVVFWIAGKGLAGPLAAFSFTALSIGGLTVVFNFFPAAASDPFWIRLLDSIARGVWRLANTNFISALIPASLIAAAGYAYKRQVEEREESQVETRALKKARESDREFEKGRADVLVEPGDGPDRRKEAKELVEQAKAYLNKKGQSDPDGRHRRTYQSMSKHDYAALAFALEERGQLSEDQAKAAAELFAIWRQYERGRASAKPVPQSVYQVISNVLDTLRAD